MRKGGDADLEGWVSYEARSLAPGGDYPVTEPRGVPDEVLSGERLRRLVRKVKLSRYSDKKYTERDLAKNRSSEDIQETKKLQGYCNMAVFYTWINLAKLN